MRPETFRANDLRRFFEQHAVATLLELKEALGTDTDSTVFRKLSELNYRSSYSHRGSYYTLDELADFDELGLWSVGTVRFSNVGTLLSTVEAMVEASEAGYYAGELEGKVHVGVKAPLVKLIRDARLLRQRVGRSYLYLSHEASRRRRQLAARKVREAELESFGAFGAGSRVRSEELKAAVVLFYSLLDEKQRRLYAGLESLKVGHGGDQRIADLLGLDASTIARGRKQLRERDSDIDRVRRKGGGRKALKKNAGDHSRDREDHEA